MRPTAIVAPVVAVILVLSACGKSMDAQALVAEAKQYQQQGNDKAAIIQLKNALQQSPNDPEIRYLLGMLYDKEGDALSAEKELNKALDLGMDPVKILPGLSRAWLGTGQFQKVLDETGKLSDKGNFAELLALRGNASLALGKVEEAKALFEQALQDKPGFADALMGLARCSLARNDIASAMNFSEEAVKLNPENSSTVLFRGDLLRAQNKIDEALADYDRAIKLNPESEAAYINRATISISTRKFETAQADLDTVRKFAPGSLSAAYTQALLDFTQGKHAVALETLQKVLSAAPGHLPSVLLAGAAQFALGSLSQAEQYIDQYLKAIPNNLYAIKLMASIQLKNNQPKEAITTLAPALKAVQQDPQLFALAGEAYMQSKDFTQASEYFEKAGALSPDNAALYTAMAMSKMGQGDSKSAIADLEQATQLHDQTGRAGVMLVLTHLQLREFDKALKAVDAQLAEQPDNPLLHNLKGGVYLGKKDLAKARASFNKALSIKSDYFPAISNLARIDLQEKHPDAAQKRFEDILQHDKKNVQAMSALAGIALSQGNREKATEWLEKASRENPDEIQPALQLGAHYLAMNEPAKALALAKKLQGTYSDNLSVTELLARAYLASGNKEAALENFEKLAARLPDSAPAQLQLAQIHATMQNTRAADELLKKALKIKPDFWEAELMQAQLAAGAGRVEDALNIAREIQKQHEKLPVGFELEGDLQMGQKNAAAAAATYEKALEKQKSSQLQIKLHTALSQSGKEKQADQRITQWLKENPADDAVRMYLAGVYLAGKKYDPAIREYKTILKQHPDHAATLNNLAWIYQEKKDPAAALDYAEKAYKQAPDSPAILDTLGWILVEKGEAERGASLLQKAVAAAPEALEIRYHYAVGLSRSGKKTEARQELEKLLAGDKPFSRKDEAKKLLESL
ncbi:XrtA/PEP-CTERM system TPR-repeat protein PrsT [Nitrosomonas sp.]|uniref:XrtA/PEP-CTERM system TPR-repeat protein PrsT n=1 Tax=Nitrosomonas sp. TaxID=42353 RepID=UPI0025FB1F4E|nr:XrtA/PEP-CTERM system TPR-repeat protein PrsT [Nitrosomonas sp.]